MVKYYFPLIMKIVQTGITNLLEVQELLLKKVGKFVKFRSFLSLLKLIKSFWGAPDKPSVSFLDPGAVAGIDLDNV